MFTYYNIERGGYCRRSQRCAHLRWFAAGLLLLWLPPGFAAEAGASDAEREQQAVAFVQMLIDDGISLLKEGDAQHHSAESLYEELEDQLLPHADVIRTARLVLGKYWKQATELQRNRFVEQFWKLLVRTYALSLSRYLDAAIEVGKPTLKSKGRAYVPVSLSLAGNVPSQVIYRIHTKNQQPQVYDVIVNGISLVRSYRASWGRVLKKEGIDKLIASIAAKN